MNSAATDRRRLDALFNPSSIAVIGASDSPGRIGGRVLKNLKLRYPGAIYPVNPNRSVVQDLTAYPSVLAIPDPPDFAIIAVPGSDVVDVIRECGERGVGAALILSAGFAETGDPDSIAAQDEIRRVVEATGLRVVGPNCVGMASLPNGIIGTFSTFDLSGRPGAPLAIVSQSGGIATGFWNEFHRLGVGASYLCTTGNEVDVTVASAIGHLVELPDVSVIAAFFEGINEADVLLRAGRRARELGKTIVAMKTAVTEPGARASVYHTASERVSDDVANELFTEAGIIRVHSPTELVYVSSAFMGQRVPAGNSLGVMTVSGGVGVIIADEASALGFQLPPPSAGAEKLIRERIPSYGSWRNPVDYTGNVVNDPTSFDVVLDAVVGEENFDAICIAGTSPATAIQMIEAITATFAKTLKPILVYSAEFEHVRLLSLNGIPAFTDVVLMVRALGKLREYAARA
jgi:acyl-CoA synthetase (NDP forming)